MKAGRIDNPQNLFLQVMKFHVRRTNLMESILIGYFPKQSTAKPNGLNVRGGRKVCSVSNSFAQEIKILRGCELPAWIRRGGRDIRNYREASSGADGVVD